MVVLSAAVTEGGQGVVEVDVGGHLARDHHQEALGHPHPCDDPEH